MIGTSIEWYNTLIDYTGTCLDPANNRELDIECIRISICEYGVKYSSIRIYWWPCSAEQMPSSLQWFSMGHYISIENPEPWLYIYSHVKEGWRRVSATTSLMDTGNTRTEWINFYTSGRTIWLFLRNWATYLKKPDENIFWHNKIVRTSIWLDNISFDPVPSSVVTAARPTYFLLKIWLSKFLQTVLKLFCSGISEDRYTYRFTKSFMGWSMVSLASLI